MWRGGCIIRSTFLKNIKDAFVKNADLKCLLLDDFFKDKMKDMQGGWRRVVACAAMNGVSVPAMSTALAFYDGCVPTCTRKRICERARAHARMHASAHVRAHGHVPALLCAHTHVRMHIMRAISLARATHRYRCERLPANLLQAQRDFFGAHTFERLDKPRGEFFHCNWTGRGGTTSSSTYNA